MNIGKILTTGIFGLAGIVSGGGCSTDFSESVKTTPMEDCEANNGVWKQWSYLDFRSGTSSCNSRTEDFGKVCTDYSECEGSCLAIEDGGKCSEFRSVFGCFAELAGGMPYEICVD
jgi:hypothetical protein